MSQENVETLRAFYEAFNEGDFDGLLPLVNSKVELRPGIDAPDSKSFYRGSEALGEFLVTIAAGPWDAVIAEPKEVIEANGDRILSIDSWRFTGRDGIELERELPTLFTFRDGLITRIDGFTDRDEALQAAGLSE
jgi:ketosteroid isomerase-like protein